MSHEKGEEQDTTEEKAGHDEDHPSTLEPWPTEPK